MMAALRAVKPDATFAAAAEQRAEVLIVRKLSTMSVARHAGGAASVPSTVIRLGGGSPRSRRWCAAGVRRVIKCRCGMAKRGWHHACRVAAFKGTNCRREQMPDAVIDLQGLTKSAIVARSSRAARASAQPDPDRGLQLADAPRELAGRPSRHPASSRTSTRWTARCACAGGRRARPCARLARRYG